MTDHALGPAAAARLARAKMLGCPKPMEPVEGQARATDRGITMTAGQDRIAGNAYYLYITPPSTTFPWIHLYRRPRGLKGQANAAIFDVPPDYESRDELALEIARAIPDDSPTLQEWRASHR